jgi:16S rRNA pseudouridine516 synthase
MRLSKFLTLSVAMTRNQAKFFIRKGRVSVDGKLVINPDLELADTSHVVFDDKQISVATRRYFLIHKPASYACTTKETEHISILRLLEDRPQEHYYYFANLLEPEATGLVLLSDDAQWTNRIQRRLLNKTWVYDVRLKSIISELQLGQIKKAYLKNLEKQVGSIIEVQKQSKKTLSVSIKKVHLQEILDVLATADLTVESFHLHQLGNLTIDNLDEGDYLEMAENEISI